MKNKDYNFIGKSIFFPDYGILAIGDLHLGYEHSLRQSGILIPEKQVRELIQELKIIFSEITKKWKLKKIIFLGDIKHSFGYEYEEKDYFRRVMEFLKDYIEEKNIILIKGNHDTIDYSHKKKMKKYYIYKDIAFIHGHEEFGILNKNVKTIVLGHIHPSVLLSDKQNIKREKYKCFLVGKFKKKDIIVLPSFLTTIEGMTVNKDEYKDYFSIIPKKSLMNFEVFAIGNDKTYNFGKIKKIIIN